MPDWVIQVIEMLGRVLGVLGAWILVILGWLVVNDQSMQRERIKIDIDRLKGLRFLVDEIESLAVKHHTSGFEETVLRDLTRKLKLLGLEFSHLERVGLLGVGWRAEVQSVRQAATGENASSVGYRRHSPYDPKVSGIYHGCDQLRSLLHRVHEHRIFPTETLRSTLARMWKRI